MIDEKIFETLYSLLATMEKSNDNFDKALYSKNTERIEASERMSDKVYARYHQLIHVNFDKGFLIEVERRIGIDKFTTCEFLDTLKDVYESFKARVDEYKGFSLEKSMDLFGSPTYFIYYKGTQYSESIDCANDESAMKHFRWCIDNNPSSPDFGM